MKNIRIALWAMVVLLTGVLGWFGFELSRIREQMVEAPYGIAFELMTQDGQLITQEALRGKPVALFFGFTHCPEICPTTLFELNGWMETVDPAGEKMRAYFITVDPQRDTQEVLQQYVSNVSKRIIGITGAPDRITDMMKGYRIFARKVLLDEKEPDGDYTMDHTASVILIDAQGRFAGTIAYEENQDVAVKKLQNLLKG